MCNIQLLNLVDLSKLNKTRTMMGCIWVGSEINCLKPCVIVRESICVLCKVAMSLDHHSGDLALSSPKIIVNLISEQSLWLSKSSIKTVLHKLRARLWLYVTCMQMVLCIHKNLCTVSISPCKNNLNLPISHTDHYALRKYKQSLSVVPNPYNHTTAFDRQSFAPFISSKFNN